MSRLNLRPRSWGLRARFLVPFIIITMGTVGTLIVSTDLSARGQGEALIRERGATVLEGMAQRLQERQRSMEDLTQLLAQQSGVATAVEVMDTASLARQLMPLRDRLELGAVEVYGADREALLHLGPIEMGVDMRRLILSAPSGRTYSTSEVSGEGVAVMASAPIEGPEGIVGTLAASTVLGGDALREAKALDGAELAVFRDGMLVSTSVADPELVHLLRDSRLMPETIEKLNRATDSFNFHLVARPLGDRGVLVALIPTQNLVQGTSQHELFLLAVVSPLAVAILSMLLVAFILARDVGGTLEAMVRVSRKLVQGNYGQRLAQSHIREVNELSQAFNFLGTQLEIQRKELESQAFYDPLTNLPNRALFLNRLKHALARAARGSSRVAVMFVDLDNFKLVNDSLGHELGDLLLVEVARRLSLSLRGVDTAARFGGDEFTILIEDAADENATIHLAERIQDRLRAPLTLIGQSVLVTASIGVAFSNPNHDRPEDLLREADAAMYRAKLGGKACCEVFDETVNADPRESMKGIPHVRQALSIENGQEIRQWPSYSATGNRPASIITPISRDQPAPGSPMQARAAVAEANSDARIVTRRPLGRFWGSVASGWRGAARPFAGGMPMPAFVVTLAFVLTTAVGGGATYAAQSALPGDPLYPVKMTVEGLRFRLTPGDGGKAEANLDCAGKRLDEAEKAIGFGRSSTAESAIEAYTGCVAQAQKHLSRAAALGWDVGELAGKLSERLSGQQAKLQAVENRVPDPARAALAKAVEETRKGLDTANALEGRKAQTGSLVEVSPALSVTGMAGTRRNEAPGFNRDEGRHKAAPVTEDPSTVRVTLTKATSDAQSLKNDTAVPGENHEESLAELSADREAVDGGRGNAALHQLEAFLNQLNAMQRSGKISGGDYAALYADYSSLVTRLGGTPGSRASAGDSPPEAVLRDEKPEPGHRSDNGDGRMVVTPTVAPALGLQGHPDGRLNDSGEQGTAVASPPVAEAPSPSRPDQDKSPGRPDGSQPQGKSVAGPAKEPAATTPTPNTQERSVGRPDVDSEHPAPVADPATRQGPVSEAPVPPSARPDSPKTDQRGSSKSP